MTEKSPITVCTPLRNGIIANTKYKVERVAEPFVVSGGNNASFSITPVASSFQVLNFHKIMLFFAFDVPFTPLQIVFEWQGRENFLLYATNGMDGDNYIYVYFPFVCQSLKVEPFVGAFTGVYYAE